MHKLIRNEQIKKQVCLFAGLVFFISSCGGGHTKKNAQKKVQEELHFQEAKHSDIPILLDAVRLENKDINLSEGQTALFFASSSPLQEIVDFYVQEMDRMGWRQLSYFAGKENFITFEKPYTVALVIIGENDRKKTTRITILMSTKE